MKEFPGGPEVESLPSNAGKVGSVSYLGTKMPRGNEAHSGNH